MSKPTVGLQRNDDELNWKIQLYDCIDKWYPIGLSFDLDIYKMHPKFIRFDDLLKSKKRANNEAYKNWKIFEGFLQEKLELYEVYSHTLDVCPSFGVRINMGKKKFGHIEHHKQFFILSSLLGPYITIYGVDRIALLEHESSPSKSYFESKYAFEAVYEWKETFDLIEPLIYSFFEDRSIIPIRILLHNINGLELPYQQSPSRKVNFFQALFDHTSPFYTKPSALEGPFKIWNSRRREN